MVGCWSVNVMLSSDNTCEINLMDLFEAKDIKSSDKMFKIEIKDASDNTAKYIAAMRKTAQKRWEKKMS
jgi:hypothetical protein